MSPRKQTRSPKPKAEPHGHPKPADRPLKTNGEDSGATALRSEPVGDVRWADVQRQSSAVQTGRVVGNRGLARMIGGQVADQPASVQRGLEQTLLVNTLVSQLAVDRAISENETLQAIHQDINALTPKTEEEDAEGRKGGEETAVRREKLIEGFKSIRGRIAVEVVAEKLGVTDALAKAVRRRFNIQLARVAPFYTQWWNANILGTKDNPAKMRTCNVSTVGMVLEALGKTAADFEGEHNLMDAIAAALGRETPAANMRFPDFLQVLAIYLEMVGNKAGLAVLAGSDPAKFEEKMGNAAMLAHGRILNSNNFNRFTSMFGVTAESHDPDLQKALTVFGKYYRPMEGDFKDFLKKKGKEKAGGKEKDRLHDDFIDKRKAGFRWRGSRAGRDIAKAEEKLAEKDTAIQAAKDKLAGYKAKLETLDPETDGRVELEKQKADEEEKLRSLEAERQSTLAEITGFRLEQAASEAVGSETDEEALVEEALPISVYQMAFIPLMQDLLGSGAQVIVIIHNHFVKLQAISEENIVVHDPAGWGKANTVVSWETARELGYFKRYNVVR